MLRSKTPQHVHMSGDRAQNTAQLLGKHTKGRNDFITATRDPQSLTGRPNVRAVKKLSDFPGDKAAVVIRYDGHPELFANARATDHVDIYHSFCDEYGIAADRLSMAGKDVDHVFHKSAAAKQGLMSRLQLQFSGANRSHGSGREKRETHHRLKENAHHMIGQLAVYLKSMGQPLYLPSDPITSMEVGIHELIHLGHAAPSDLKLLVTRLDECKQAVMAQDVFYATKETGQVNLEPGEPLLP